MRWPAAVDPRQTLLLPRTPKGVPFSMRRRPGTARILRYANAEVDGADAEILKANVIFRAVVCPRGRHLVRFTFHPFAGAIAEVVGTLKHAR